MGDSNGSPGADDGVEQPAAPPVGQPEPSEVNPSGAEPLPVGDEPDVAAPPSPAIGPEVEPVDPEPGPNGPEIDPAAPEPEPDTEDPEPEREDAEPTAPNPGPSVIPEFPPDVQQVVFASLSPAEVLEEISRMKVSELVHFHRRIEIAFALNGISDEYKRLPTRQRIAMIDQIIAEEDAAASH